MGMFDEIRCETPLPDGNPTEGIIFQTKSFPEPCLQRYVITKAGRLVDLRGNDLEPDGHITFYTSRPTENAGSDPEREWPEYRAQFSAGNLVSIVRVADDRSDHVRYGLASFRWFDTPSFALDPGDPEQHERQQ